MIDKTKYTRELLNKTTELLTESSKKSITESTDFYEEGNFNKFFYSLCKKE